MVSTIARWQSDGFVGRGIGYEEPLIRFQNTGNDTAFTVVVRDTLDSRLDLASFEVTAASHPLRTLLAANGTIEFHFDDILLPDSNTNELASHGFVRYRVLAKADQTLPLLVRNTAYIYFDLNPPVVTNTTENIFVETLVGTHQPETQRLLIAPNPSSGKVRLDIPDTGLLRLFDSQGRLVYQQTEVSPGNATFYFDHLVPGLYRVQFNTAEQVFSGRWLRL